MSHSTGQIYLPFEENKHKIVIKHTRIEINDYILGNSSYLEYMFSVFDPIYHMRFAKGAEYDEKNRRLILPRGMNIDTLKRIFNVEPFVDKNHDPFVNTDPLMIKYLAKDERQLEILKFILGEDKYAYTKTKSQLAINSTTGSGKTFIAVATICFTGSRAIIITSSTNWLRQWNDKILEYTQLTDDDIYMIIGKAAINKLLNSDPTKYQIFLASHATIQSYGNNHPDGWHAVDELFKHLKCGLKLYDETNLVA